ncbi:MAG TPA: HAMP domain-containing methyl-accepting chemotaxis protein [Kofleriaceae bacterium]|nr:HAMP domain-containing methyl-accepting chemotaxis protein [Kofleriaceae bacterium]
MSPTLRLVLAFFGLEALFIPLISAAYLSALDVDKGKPTAIAILVIVHLVRFAICAAVLVRTLRPLERWRTLPESRQDADSTLDAARAVYRAPYVFGFTYLVVWIVVFPLILLIYLLGFPDEIPLDPHVKVAIVLLGAACICGPSAYAFPTVEWLLSSDTRQVSARLQDHRVQYRGTGMSLATRLMVFALVIGAAGSLWLGGIDYLDNARGRSRMLDAQNQIAVLELASSARTPDPATGRLPDPMSLADTASGAFVVRGTGLGEVRGDLARATLLEHPELAKRLEVAIGDRPSGDVFDKRTGIAVAYARVDAQTVLGRVEETNVGPGTSFWAMQLPFFVLIAMWAPISAWLVSRSTVMPLLKLSAVVEDIRLGRVLDAERVAIYHHDETGRLGADVNGMLDVLRTLSAQARSIGTGDLSTSFTIGGDLGESFRAQLESLRTIVGHLAQNATQLGAAAAELYAASQEQETAAGHQSAGVNEVGKTMESLLAAAAHISDATQGVLAKAERTRETTDRTAQKIGELSAHAGRIGEILDVIREIADRSDLLALNASLEGTRAGEAGRGFTLVAAEMRKLAERVMASVGDIKQLVADVRASVASTIMVTEESAKLADGTTESARQISLVTQQQSSGTEQAAQSMRDVATMLTQSLSATQQMRSLAANLKGQADQLSTIVARFRISNGADQSST